MSRASPIARSASPEMQMDSALRTPESGHQNYTVSVHAARRAAVGTMATPPTLAAADCVSYFCSYVDLLYRYYRFIVTVSGER